MANDPVLYESRERIAIITLNRPEALNAMNDAMIEGLHEAWRRFNESDDRCAVVRGAGERAFSAGLDLKAPAKEFWRGMPTVGIDVDKPTIAAIDGHCVGGGLVLSSAVQGGAEPLSYAWSIDSGSPNTSLGQFTEPHSFVAAPRFVPSAPGDYALRLTVVDSAAPACVALPAASACRTSGHRHSP